LEGEGEAPVVAALPVPLSPLRPLPRKRSLCKAAVAQIQRHSGLDSALIRHCTTRGDGAIVPVRGISQVSTLVRTDAYGRRPCLLPESQGLWEQTWASAM
jgi:hypothetical protein